MLCKHSGLHFLGSIVGSGDWGILITMAILLMLLLLLTMSTLSTLLISCENTWVTICAVGVLICVLYRVLCEFDLHAYLVRSCTSCMVRGRSLVFYMHV